MSLGTLIEWTDATFNPWTGCTKVSPGCKFCYAALFDSRHLHERLSHWGPGARRMPASEAQWQEVLALERRAVREARTFRVFCASMADVFEEEAPAVAQARLWATIEQTPHLHWQLLTKRPERIYQTVPPTWRTDPPQNVFYGTSVESADYLWRVETLGNLVTHPNHRFLSVEPLLGPITFPDIDLDRMGWVILGGESGPSARPMSAQWARSVRDQCVAAGIPLFFKQWGQHDETGARQRSKHFPGYDLLDGRAWKQFPEVRS